MNKKETPGGAIQRHLSLGGGLAKTPSAFARAVLYGPAKPELPFWQLKKEAEAILPSLLLAAQRDKKPANRPAPRPLARGEVAGTGQRAGRSGKTSRKRAEKAEKKLAA
jgi:hypothetical protein